MQGEIITKEVKDVTVVGTGIPAMEMDNITTIMKDIHRIQKEMKVQLIRLKRTEVAKSTQWEIRTIEKQKLKPDILDNLFKSSCPAIVEQMVVVIIRIAVRRQRTAEMEMEILVNSLVLVFETVSIVEIPNIWLRSVQLGRNTSKQES
jgi:hypothetical protein